MSTVVVIGAGPAGLAAAYSAAMDGNSVTVIEKNEKAGKKLYITGKGRCNLTNDSIPQEFLKNVVRNSKFLTGALYGFSPEKTIEFFEESGLKLKTERGGRVFPQSDKASDVTACLLKCLNRLGVEMRYSETVKEISVQNGAVDKVITDCAEYPADCVIVCTGGISYPATGSTGDGYRFANALDIPVIPPKASLVGIVTKNKDVTEMQGLSLKNVRVSAWISGKKVYSELGEMLFTHYGVSGPLILSLSALINRVDLRDVKIELDLKPALDEITLDKRILRDFDDYKNKQFKHALDDLLPKSMIPTVIARSNIAGDKPVHSITQVERRNLIAVLKHFELIATQLRPIEEAIVTSGGVDCKAVSPKTMESKTIKGLRFAGEVLDVDAFTGGYNIQIALSTGFAAGRAIREEN